MPIRMVMPTGRDRRARVRGEDGFSLIEVLVVALLLPVVLLATLNVLDTGAKVAPKSIEYANAVQEAGTGVSRMMRELRQAYRIVGTTANSVTFDGVFAGVDQRVSIQCDVPYPTTTGNPHAGDYRRCLRVSAPTGTALPDISTGTVEVDRVLNGTVAQPVFTFTPDAIAPSYINVHLQLAARGEASAGLNHEITIDNGTLLRNNVLGN
jgi:prepilin-type N-terminal cleavage/methylation domain-containing protein